MNNSKWLRRWAKNRAIVDCAVEDFDITVNVNNLLIPFSASMPQDHYNLYRNEAEFPGLVSQYANVLAAGLLRKPPQTNFPVSIGLVKEAIMEELTTGRGFLWVDQDVLRVLMAEELVEWSTTHTCVLICVEEGDRVSEYRYKYQMTDDGVIVTRSVNGVEEQAVPLMVNGEALRVIPVFPLNGSMNVQPSILQPLIDREVGLYNKLSRRNHLLYGAATYTPVIMSDVSEDQFNKIVENGIGSWIHLERGATADILAAPTDALSKMESAIASTVEDMARMGIRILSPEGGQSSGVALEIRNSAQTAQLGLLNARISEAFQAACQLHARWRTKDPFMEEVTFQLSADFNPVPLGSDWLKLVTDWYQAGLIPRDLWLSIAKSNDVVPADYDDERGRQDIEKDNLVSARSRIDINV